MLELKGMYDSNCRERFIIKTDEGPFKIYYGDDLCLYWSCNPSDDEMNDCYKYTITKDNTNVYNIIDEFYDSVISKRPFKHFNVNDSEKYYAYDDNNLVKNGAIEWHSDDFSYDAASVLKIEKDLETKNFIISFHKSKIVSDDISPFCTYAVKISTGASRYDPYNATFINMYQQLCNYCEQHGYVFSNGKNKKKKVRIR